MNLKIKLESYLRVNLLGLGPRLLPGRGLTKGEKHCITVRSRVRVLQQSEAWQVSHVVI
jgi:hypothetical protein